MQNSQVSAYDHTREKDTKNIDTFLRYFVDIFLPSKPERGKHALIKMNVMLWIRVKVLFGII